MGNLRFRLLTVLFCSVAFGGYVFATPIDPIIDLEPGAGSNSYLGGQVLFTFNATAGNTNCVSDGSVGDTSIVSCGMTTNFLRPGTDGTGVFSNNTGVDITNIHVHIDTFFFPDGTKNLNNVAANVDQMGFQTFARPDHPLLFPNTPIPDAGGNGATFTGGVVPVCQPNFFESCVPGEFTIGYAEVRIPEGGSAVIEFDANHPISTPEPATFGMIFGTLSGAWLVRKRLRHKILPESEN